MRSRNTSYWEYDLVGNCFHLQLHQVLSGQGFKVSQTSRPQIPSTKFGSETICFDPKANKTETYRNLNTHQSSAILGMSSILKGKEKGCVFFPSPRKSMIVRTPTSAAIKCSTVTPLCWSTAARFAPAFGRRIWEPRFQCKNVRFLPLL